jgi:hypothetical protein
VEKEVAGAIVFLPASCRTTLTSHAADSILTLLRGSIPPPPLVLQYLQQALQTTANSSSSPDTRLLRPGFVARQAITAVLPLPSSEVVFRTINTALSASPKEPTYAASTSDEAAEGLLLVLDNLLPLLSSASSAVRAPQTARWISHFLTHPPHRLSKKNVSEELLEQCSAALQQSIEALGMDEREEMKAVRTELEGVLARLTGGGRGRVALEVSLDEAGRPLSYEPDAILLVSHLVRPSLPPFPLSSLPSLPLLISSRPQLNDPYLPLSSSTAQLHSFLRSRLAQSSFRGSTSGEALTRGFADVLLPLLATVGRLKREDKAVEGLMLAKVRLCPHPASCRFQD